jgi:hypothetical protein
MNAAFHLGPERRVYAAAAREELRFMKHYQAPWGTSPAVILSPAAPEKFVLDLPLSAHPA